MLDFVHNFIIISLCTLGVNLFAYMKLFKINKYYGAENIMQFVVSALVKDLENYHRLRWNFVYF